MFGWWYGSCNSVMSVNRKAVVIYGSTDLWIYWDIADKLCFFYRDISHNLFAKQVLQQWALKVSADNSRHTQKLRTLGIPEDIPQQWMSLLA